MILKPPFIMSSRLLPAVKIAGATLSIEAINTSSDGRIVYQWHWDFEKQSITASDLKSGVGDKLDYQQTMGGLLSFMVACAESLQCGSDENSSLFPQEMHEWLTQNSDEIGMLALELEETSNLVEQ